MKVSVTTGKLIKALEALGHTVFTEGDYNVNIVGIRADDESPDAFNDKICLLYKQSGQWVLHQFDATTDPGLYWLENPMNVNGTAILNPGQYPGMFSLGMHQGQYTALIQSAPCTVYRDNNKDRQFDKHDTQRGLFGINLHRASEHQVSQSVGRWSAGCQVIADPFEYHVLLAVCQKAMQVWGNRFSYTLIAERDLKPPKKE